MSAVYLIRHGQGGTRRQYDALSELGQTQARLAGEFLVTQNIQFRAIYSGALTRQQETADAVCKAYLRSGLHAPEIVVDPGWNEFDLDQVYEGIAPLLCADDPQFKSDYDNLLAQLQDEHAPEQRRWTPCDVSVVRAWLEGKYAFAGESFAVFQQRVCGCLSRLRDHTRGDAVAVFTSATPIAVWAAMALGVTNGQVLRLAGVMYNAAITTLRIRQEEVTLFSFNGVPHLPDPALRTFR